MKFRVFFFSLTKYTKNELQETLINRFLQRQTRWARIGVKLGIKARDTFVYQGFLKF